MSMKAHQTPIGKSDTHLTPHWILAPLGRFRLDPACPEYVRFPIGVCNFSKSDDGLTQKWQGRVWLNPPFNRYERPKWMKKMADHGDGIMLIPAATETKPFIEYVWKKADAVCFLDKRPHFLNEFGVPHKANWGCSIVLVAYGYENAYRLKESGLGQVFILNKSANKFKSP